jgi:hypothetical protein
MFKVDIAEIVAVKVTTYTIEAKSWIELKDAFPSCLAFDK